MAKTVTYGNGVTEILTPASINGDNIILAGTSAASEPFVELADSSTPYVLGSISENGTYGRVEIGPVNQAAVPNLSVGSLNLSHGNLFLGTTDGGSITITGTSHITNGSTYVAWGGRYQADTTTLKGTMVVAGGSTADFSHTRLSGPGTIHAESGSIVDVKMISAGLRVDLADAKLIYTNRTGLSGGGISGGTIHQTAGSTTEVLNAATSVREVFHRSSGILDLFNAAGGITAELRFVGDSKLYTTPAAGGLMDITTAHHATSLPTIFTT